VAKVNLIYLQKSLILTNVKRQRDRAWRAVMTEEQWNEININSRKRRATMTENQRNEVNRKRHINSRKRRATMTDEQHRIKFIGSVMKRIIEERPNLCSLKYQI
jgi:hypothetical protein